jgi:hypothetical protein
LSQTVAIGNRIRASRAGSQGLLRVPESRVAWSRDEGELTVDSEGGQCACEIVVRDVEDLRRGAKVGGAQLPRVSLNPLKHKRPRAMERGTVHS